MTGGASGCARKFAVFFLDSEMIAPADRCSVAESTVTDRSSTATTMPPDPTLCFRWTSAEPEDVEIVDYH